jgi:hypothetical protein
MISANYTPKSNEFRVTELLKGTREILLERRHSHEEVQDVAENIWAIFGTAVHSVLERSKETDTQIKESRVFIDDKNTGYRLSGQFDLYDNKYEEVVDYKTASVWKIIYKSFDDWRKQTLIYCYLLQKSGFPANKSRIVALLKDHSKLKAKLDDNYPQYPVVTVPFNFTDEDFKEIKEFISSKLAEIKAYSDKPDDELPMCSEEQRFNSGAKYAVMVKGKKRAVRVLTSKDEAEQYISKQTDDKPYTIIERPGEDKKCNDYCRCKEFCSYYKKLRSERL